MNKQWSEFVTNSLVLIVGWMALAWMASHESWIWNLHDRLARHEIWIIFHSPPLSLALSFLLFFYMRGRTGQWLSMHATRTTEEKWHEMLVQDTVLRGNKNAKNVMYASRATNWTAKSICTQRALAVCRVVWPDTWKWGPYHINTSWM